jgi:hypothetical protein
MADMIRKSVCQKNENNAGQFAGIRHNDFNGE